MKAVLAINGFSRKPNPRHVSHFFPLIVKSGKNFPATKLNPRLQFKRKDIIMHFDKFWVKYSSKITPFRRSKYEKKNIHKSGIVHNMKKKKGLLCVLLWIVFVVLLCRLHASNSETASRAGDKAERKKIYWLVSIDHNLLTKKTTQPNKPVSLRFATPKLSSCGLSRFTFKSETPLTCFIFYDSEHETLTAITMNATLEKNSD